MIGIQYIINCSNFCCIYDVLCTVFDVDAYGIPFGIDKGLELRFSNICFEGCKYCNLETLLTWVRDSITSGFSWCVVDGLGAGFAVNSDVIKHFFDEVTERISFGLNVEIEIGHSDIYFEGCSNVMLEVIVTGVWYGINCWVAWYYVRVFVAGFDGYAYGISFRIDQGIYIGFQIYIFRVVMKWILKVLWHE